MLKKSKHSYFSRINHSDPKSFWKATKAIQREESQIPFLCSTDGEVISDDSTKANILNDFFSSCFNHNVPPLSHCDSDVLFDLTSMNGTCCPDDNLCSIDEVEALLLTLNTSKASGPDNISARMLKSTAVSIANSVTTLFNMSIKAGVIPNDWKVSSVVSIPKGKGGNLPSNFRPISLLCILSKLLEKHIHQIILKQLDHLHPLNSHQWGFRPQRSTVCALLSVTHNWLYSLNAGKEVCAVFFDMCKAFDTVPHLPLLLKMRDFYLTGYTSLVIFLPS